MYRPPFFFFYIFLLLFFCQQFDYIVVEGFASLSGRGGKREEDFIADVRGYGLAMVASAFVLKF